MRHRVNHNFLALTSITYFIFLLSSFLPLSAAMSVTSSVHIKTPSPLVTIAVSNKNPIIISTRSIDPFFIPGEMANINYSDAATNGGVLSYTLHGSAHEMNLVAKSDCENLSITLTSLNDATKHATVNVSNQKTTLFTHLNNSFDSYTITYFLRGLEEEKESINVEFALTPYSN